MWLAKNSSQNSFVENNCQLTEFWFINQTADRKWAGNSLELTEWSNPKAFLLLAQSLCTEILCWNCRSDCMLAAERGWAPHLHHTYLLSQSHSHQHNGLLQRTRLNETGTWGGIFMTVCTNVSSLLIAQSFREESKRKTEKEKILMCMNKMSRTGKQRGKKRPGNNHLSCIFSNSH